MADQGKMGAKSMRALVDYLKLRLSRMENDQLEGFDGKPVKSWLEWQRMEASRKVAIHQEWDKYYAKVKESEAASLFEKMRYAVKEENLKAIHETKIRVKELREEMSFMPSPKFPDPEWLEKGCWEVMIYKSLKNKTNELNESLKKGGDQTAVAEDVFGL